MALLHINYFSTALQKQSAMYVVLPDSDPPYRVVYQLHGLSDDYTIWLRRTSIERYADDREADGRHAGWRPVVLLRYEGRDGQLRAAYPGVGALHRQHVPHRSAPRTGAASAGYPWAGMAR